MPSGIVHKEEALVGVFDRECPRKFSLALAPGIGVGSAGVFTRFAKDMGRGGLGQSSVVIEVKDFDSAITIACDKQPAMDAFQRPLGRSPNAVAGSTSVGHTAHEGRIPPDVLLAELVSSRLAIALCIRSERQN